jgi:hypothetical protein
MEEAGFSATFVTTYQFIRCHNPEDRNLDLHNYIYSFSTVSVGAEHDSPECNDVWMNPKQYQQGGCSSTIEMGDVWIDKLLI